VHDEHSFDAIALISRGCANPGQHVVADRHWRAG
jgi:hypothetical protein